MFAILPHTKPIFWQDRLNSLSPPLIYQSLLIEQLGHELWKRLSGILINLKKPKNLRNLLFERQPEALFEIGDGAALRKKFLECMSLFNGE